MTLVWRMVLGRDMGYGWERSGEKFKTVATLHSRVDQGGGSESEIKEEDTRGNSEVEGTVS